MSKNILIIEDDPNLIELLELHLGDLGCQVVSRPDGEEGLDEALGGDHDLVILDLNLPNLDGLEVCRRVRARKPLLPILMLTSRSDELDKVLGLELGADDYMTKPFGIRELMARVKAIFRRKDAREKEVATEGEPRPIRSGDLVVDREKRKVTLGDRPVALTAKEFDLLHLFATHPGRAYSRADLLDQVWGYQFEGYEHTVNSHISRLRAKIEEDPSRPVFIRTVWGIGYRFAEPEELSR